ncbi:MAG: precorrin-4 C(11)-methyltransferase [Chloroflexota bacterium]
MKGNSTGIVYFIGAGPGDPELLTVKGQRLLAGADVVLYAGSLVSAEILQYASAGAEIHSSAGMKLEQQIALMSASAKEGKVVARLHTGDPSIYGAIAEQMKALDALQIPYQVIPGVSSAFAAAAALGLEYTLPGITQTLILTRLSGRTPVPEREDLRLLAAHRSSLVIFLSTGMIQEVVAELRAAGYPPETPLALVYRASWPDQTIIRGTLADIAGQTEAQELTHQGLIIVSPALETAAPQASHLYGGFQESPPRRTGTAILTLTAPAVELGRSLLANLPDATLYLPERLSSPQDKDQPNIRPFRESIRQALQGAFMQHESLVCIMASGIVVRELASLLKNKHSDPAVVVMDAEGSFAVSLLGGHEGGANRLARRLAELTGGQAVITTASDVQGIPALDVLAKERGWKLDRRSDLAAVMAARVNGEPVALLQDPECAWMTAEETGDWLLCASWQDARERGLPALVVVSFRASSPDLWPASAKLAVYYPPALVVGVGCNRGAPADEIQAAIEITLQQAGLARESVACLASVEDKAAEEGLLQVSARNGWPLKVVTRQQIREIGPLPNPSAHAQEALGVPGVAEPAALLVARSKTLLVEKRKFPNVTVAVALKKETL